MPHLGTIHGLQQRLRRQRGGRLACVKLSVTGQPRPRRAVHLRPELLDQRPLVLEQGEALRHLLDLPCSEHGVHLGCAHVAPRRRQVLARIQAAVDGLRRVDQVLDARAQGIQAVVGGDGARRGAAGCSTSIGGAGCQLAQPRLQPLGQVYQTAAGAGNVDDGVGA